MHSRALQLFSDFTTEDTESTEENRECKSRNPKRNLETLIAAFLNIGTLAASLLLSPAASAGPTPADKRKPGLYWTFETTRGKSPASFSRRKRRSRCARWWGWRSEKFRTCIRKRSKPNARNFFDGLMFRPRDSGRHDSGRRFARHRRRTSPKGRAFRTRAKSRPSLKFDTPGRLAMANSGPDTNDTQFFITESAYPSFNGKYTIWGQCENVGRGESDRASAARRGRHACHAGSHPARRDRARRPCSRRRSGIRRRRMLRPNSSCSLNQSILNGWFYVDTAGWQWDIRANREVIHERQGFPFSGGDDWPGAAVHFGRRRTTDRRSTTRN